MEFADSWLPSANPKISKRFKHQHNKIDERKHLQLAKKTVMTLKIGILTNKAKFLFVLHSLQKLNPQPILVFFDSLNANLKFDTFYALFI